MGRICLALALVSGDSNHWPGKTTDKEAESNFAFTKKNSGSECKHMPM